MRLLRDSILLFGLLLIAPWRSHSRRHVLRLWQVFKPRDVSEPRILVHAVSLGEVNASARLVRELQQVGLDVVCSSTTLSGQQRLRELHPNTSHIEWPLDISFCCKRWLDHVNPSVLVLVELEVWPTLIAMAKQRGIPVLVVNGRLSPRSFQRSTRWKPLLRDGYANLSRVFAQSKEDASRFCKMGVAEERISVHPNLKWDREPASSEDVEAIRIALRLDPARAVVLFASSAPEEHPIFAKSIPSSWQAVVAPRRPEWFDDALQAFPNARMRTDPHASGDIIVLNTLGELDAVFQLADVVVMGRSFGPRHGSDPMGPAAAGRPILMGPNHGDFLPAVELLKAAGALQVVHDDELALRVSEISNCRETLDRMGAAGNRVAEDSQGVSRLIAGEIAQQTQPPRRDRGGAEEKEESVQQIAKQTSAHRGAHGHK